MIKNIFIMLFAMLLFIMVCINGKDIVEQNSVAWLMAAIVISGGAVIGSIVKFMREL